jgi:hypothetical protein
LKFEVLAVKITTDSPLHAEVLAAQSQVHRELAGNAFGGAFLDGDDGAQDWSNGPDTPYRAAKLGRRDGPAEFGRFYES